MTSDAAPHERVPRKRVSYKQFVARSSPYYGLAAFWAFEKPDKLPVEGRAFALGMVSLAFYILLFRYEDVITHFAVLARQESGLYFLLPIGIALVFSLVHGAFTSRFWKAVGLEPNDDEKKT